MINPNDLAHAREQSEQYSREAHSLRSNLARVTAARDMLLQNAEANREPSVPVSALQPLCSRYIGDPEYYAENLVHDLQTLILDAEQEASDE